MHRRIILSIIVAFVAACATTKTSPPPVYKSSDRGVGLSAAAYSPDGSFAAVANLHRIWIFDAKAKTRVLTFFGRYRYGTNNTLVFIDNGLIATTGMTGHLSDQSSQAAIIIWNISDQFSEPVVIALPELDRFAIALSRSDARGTLAVGGENGAVMLIAFDESGAFFKRQLPGLSGPVLDLVFSRDGSMLAAGGVAPEIRIWNTESLEEVGSLPVNGNVYDLDLIPGERTLLVAGDELHLWKFLTEEELADIDNPTLAGDYITVGALAAAWTLMAVAAGSVGAPINVPQLSDTRVPDYGFCKRVTAISPNGKYLADIHSGITKEKIRIIDIASGEVVESLNPRGGHSCGIAFSPDGSGLLIGNNRVARIYDTKTWEYADLPLGLYREK